LKEVAYERYMILGLAAVSVALLGGCLPTFGAPKPRKTVSADERVEKFRREVEKLNNRSVIISEVRMSAAENGGTDCLSKPQILISIRSDLPKRWKESVIGHELGHAYLCGSGFTNYVYTITPEGAKQPQRVIIDEGNLLQSCYYDLLADKAARKHGFDPSISVDASAKDLSLPSEGVRVLSMRLGRIWDMYAATLIFCREKRKHSFRNAVFEKPFLSATDTMEVLKNIRTKLNGVSCDTPPSCFEAMLKLRDAAGFGGFIRYSDPSTKALN
jgi:hypothetical protein